MPYVTWIFITSYETNTDFALTPLAACSLKLFAGIKFLANL